MRHTHRPTFVAFIVVTLLARAAPIQGQSAPAVVSERLRAGSAAAPPVDTHDVAVLRLRAPGATKYRFDAYVDSQDGKTYLHSYDTVGGVYTAAILRALSLAIQAPTSITSTLAVTSDTSLSGFVGHPDYASQTTRWRVTADGAADFRYLFVDEMHAKAFIADLEQALAGGQIITKSVAQIAQDFRCPATPGLSTLVVKDLPGAPDMQVFEVNDYVVVRTFARASGSLTIGDCVGTVESPDTSGNGTQSWVFRRGTTNTGAMAEGTIVPADGLALDYGVSGNGYYEVNAIDGQYGVNSPYAQIVTWTTAPTAANKTIRARFGKLTGITGVANEFGMIAGTYAASGGQFFRASNQVFELHGINLLMWDGSTTTVKLDRSAPSFALGNPLPTSYSAGTGIWMGNDAGIYKFRVGVPGGSSASWDGTTFAINGQVTANTGTIGGWQIGSSTLTGGDATLASNGNLTLGTGNNVVRLSATDASFRLWVGNATASSAPFRVSLAGAITSTAGAIGGWTIGATSLTSGSGATTVGVDSGGTNPAFYAGSATPGSAPFRVTTGGAVTMTNANVTGTITSTAGTIGGWTIGSTTLTGGDATLASTGNLTLGTVNDVFRASADDATHRLWIGNATAGSAPFRVTKSGGVTVANLSSSDGAVTIGSNGIDVVGGSGAGYKFLSGAKLFNNTIDVSLVLRISDKDYTFDNADGFFVTSAVNLGLDSSPWATTYTNNLRIKTLSGVGNDYACINASGDIFRSDTAC